MEFCASCCLSTQCLECEFSTLPIPVSGVVGMKFESVKRSKFAYKHVGDMHVYDSFNIGVVVVIGNWG